MIELCVRCWWYACVRVMCRLCTVLFLRVCVLLPTCVLSVCCQMPLSLPQLRQFVFVSLNPLLTGEHYQESVCAKLYRCVDRLTDGLRDTLAHYYATYVCACVCLCICLCVCLRIVLVSSETVCPHPHYVGLGIVVAGFRTDTRCCTFV